MDKYEYREKTEQIMKYVQTKSYDKAKEIAETIDWKRVKNASMLCTVSEIYEYTGEYQKSREILFIAYDRSPGSRKIVYRLGTLALRLGETEEALDCYEEFVSMAPKDPNQYILKYKILKAQNAPLKEQIRIVSEVLHSRRYNEDVKKMVKGVMIESYLEEGNQKISDHMTYGKSITDPCLGWEDTEQLIYKIAEEC